MLRNLRPRKIKFMRRVRRPTLGLRSAWLKMKQTIRYRTIRAVVTQITMRNNDSNKTEY